MIQPTSYREHQFNRNLAITGVAGGAALIGAAILGGAGVLPMPAAMSVTFAILSFSSLTIAITPLLITAVAVGLIGCALLVYASVKIKEHQNTLHLLKSFEHEPEIFQSIAVLTPAERRNILKLPEEERADAIIQYQKQHCFSANLKLLEKEFGDNIDELYKCANFPLPPFIEDITPLELKVAAAEKLALKSIYATRSLIEEECKTIYFSKNPRMIPLFEALAQEQNIREFTCLMYLVDFPSIKMDNYLFLKENEITIAALKTTLCKNQNNDALTLEELKENFLESPIFFEGWVPFGELDLFSATRAPDIEEIHNEEFLEAMRARIEESHLFPITNKTDLTLIHAFCQDYIREILKKESVTAGDNLNTTYLLLISQLDKPSIECLTNILREILFSPGYASRPEISCCASPFIFAFLPQNRTYI